ncbi:hypothetical protein Pmar_PMAR022429 [Perkinsus marinus ATCC 50983]|uniref:Uncharacterized protein n=1 Tax=Perkinsus marinus (strain ATCC 50983 / TXsc) TaxID=423536 RepID=C5L254_PERM5|nr:hypothetical protein Pmar_PMAR022429 [Perkinsus marinus ATCC 50983]EER09190.1 hypothetical protein Pmar_PMAR022429 [Perkinsus marinus ATCC 50983]|eukprot:XP_002777374.1 hypothetical protein Pmar_PMAR022429 [Perkinsus marinus ATCC 50983]
MNTIGPLEYGGCTSSRWLSIPGLRWGAVDIVVTTPHHFVADLDRCAETGGSVNQLHPAAVIFDEADMIFHEMRSLMVMEADAL